MPNSDPEIKYKRYDPVISAGANSPWLTRAFLKDGETLKPMQRAGIIVISLMVIAWGVYFAADSFDAFHNGSPRYLLFGAPSLFLLAIGLMGFTNALRFRRRKSDD